MCRWLSYQGAPILLEDLLIRPAHSMLDQSLHAQASRSPTNGDGYGVGWYGKSPRPGLFRSIQPAWNNLNLRDLAAQVESHLFLAHVRATTTGAVQETNCHPFRHGRWLFVHNGAIEQFARVRRELLLVVAPELFNEVLGTTDSEVMFFLALTLGLDADPLGALARMAGMVERVGRAQGIDHPLIMTLGLTDGERIYAVRYASDGNAPTLYHSIAAHEILAMNPELNGRLSPDARAVVSEPFGGLADAWVPIPPGTAIVVERGEVSTRAFVPAA